MMQASCYGRLGADPVERTTRTGKTMATASLAVDVGRDAENEATLWVSVAAFGRQAEALMRHKKGDLVAALGRLTKNTWTDRAGEERDGWNLTAEALVSARTVRPGGGRKRGESEGDAEPEHAEEEFQDDAIPF